MTLMGTMNRLSRPSMKQPPAIRVIKPAADADRWRTAGRGANCHRDRQNGTATDRLPDTVHYSTGRMTPIEQAYVGELTGSITGEVFCYG